MHDDSWKAPKNAKLAFKVRAAEANVLVVLIDDHAAQVNVADGPRWQDVMLSPRDFQNAAGEAMQNWRNIRQFKFSPTEYLRPKQGQTTPPRVAGKRWLGSPPEFRELPWQLPTDNRDAGESRLFNVLPQSALQNPDDQLGTTVISSIRPIRFSSRSGLPIAKAPIFHLQGHCARVVFHAANVALLSERRDGFASPVEPDLSEEQGHNMWRTWFQSWTPNDAVPTLVLGQPLSKSLLAADGTLKQN